MIYVYAVALSVLLCAEIALLFYAVTHTSVIEQAASQVVLDIWDKQCVCRASTSDQTPCTPSASECFHPDVPLPPNQTRACEPCRNYLDATVCSHLLYATPDACAQHVSSALGAEGKIFAIVLSGMAVLQGTACFYALRIAKWLSAVSRAERDEEALLALAYRSGRLDERYF